MEKKNIIILGGDKRFEWVKTQLSDKGFSVCECKDGTELLSHTENGKTVVLPLPVSRDGVNINMNCEREPISLKTLVSCLEKGDTVIGGIVSPQLKAELIKKGVAVFDYYDGEMINENAVLTAKALLNVFSENNIDFHNMRSLITGFGRTARATADLLFTENCDFSICARSEQAEKEAKNKDYSFFYLDALPDKIKDYRLVINTVPALILNEKVLSEADKSTVIVDIASAPFGADENTAKAFSIKLIRALSLPGKYCPRQAGALIADRIESICSGGR